MERLWKSTTCVVSMVLVLVLCSVSYADVVWQIRDSMNVGRQGHVTGVAHDKFYALGGNNGSGTMFNSVESYNAATNDWTTECALPAALTDGASASLDNKIYLFGGVPQGGGEVNWAWEYDPVACATKSLAPMPTSRGGASAVVDGRDIYLIGGSRAGVRLSTVEIYNVDSNTWRPGPSMPTARTAMACEKVGTRIFAINGYTDTSISRIEALNLASGEWESLPAVCSARCLMASVVYGAKIYLMGGNNNIAPLLNLVEVYDTEAGTCASLSPLHEAKDSPGAEIINGIIYVAGGDVAVGGTAPSTMLEAAYLPSANPIAYWSFDNPGNPGNDDSDGHNGTVIGATWTSEGCAHDALSFDGINDQVLVNDDGALSGMPGLTIACWLNASSFSRNFAYLVSKDNQGDADNRTDSYYLGVGYTQGGTTQLQAGVWSGTHSWLASEEGLVTYRSALSTLEWRHAAVTYDGLTLRLYLNGSEVASSPFVAPLERLNYNPSTPLRIGQVSGPRENYFHGLIDEVYLFNRALSAEEIADLCGPVNVTDKTSVNYSGVTFDRVTNVESGNCTIRNNCSNTLVAPMRLVIDTISNASATVANADGTTTEGKPYFDFSGSLGADNELPPGETTAAKVVKFRNPGRVRFTWTKSVWAVVK
ncbi:hypothetical protein HZA56_16820 [Candidatus Poribacteria bacterium]|nr:hypothetical protein [Candidatus Poribacteria bacterium]